jgi:hypothetical protein
MSCTHLLAACGTAFDVRQVALLNKQLLFYVVPDAKLFEVAHEIGVHFEELAVQRTAAKNLAKLWIDAWRGTRHMSNVRCWRHRHQCGIAHTLGGFLAQLFPVKSLLARHINLDTLRSISSSVNGVNRQFALAPATSLKVGVAAASLGEISADSSIA